LREGTLSGASHEEYNSFRNRVTKLYIEVSKYQDEFNMMENKIQVLAKASLELEEFSPGLMKKISDFKSKYDDFDSETGSNPARDEIGEWYKPTISQRMQIAMQGLSTSYGPTDLNKSNLGIAEKLFDNLANKVKELKSELELLENEVKELNPPHLSGSGIN